MSTTDTGQAESQVNKQLFLMDQSLSNLGEAINVLEARLKPILTLESTDTKATAGPPIGLVPLATSIHEDAEIARALLARIDSIIQRLQL